VKRGSGVFAFATFCSGAAALVYQVLWVKQLTLVVGIEVYSVAVAVSAFFAGLAVGGLVIGRWADKVARPLILFASLEAGIAALGVASTFVLAHSANLFVAMSAWSGPLAWALPFLLVGVPAFFMGGTLPVAVRSFSQDQGKVATVGGIIYAANTAGGIAGVLLCSFALLPWLGVRGSAFAAAALNLVASAGGLLLDRRFRTVSKTNERTVMEPVRVALALYAIAGGIALGYEVIWTQAIVQFLSTRTFAFSVVLATYLAGLAAGSAIYARFANRIRDHWGVFGFLIAVAGLCSLAEIAGLGLWQLQVQAAFGNVVFSVTGSQGASMGARFLVAALGVVFVPCVLLGAAFPAALRLVAREPLVGRDVGTIVALNTAGGIVGTLLTGFILLPAFGLVRTLAVLATGAAAVGVVAVWRGGLRWVVVAIALVTIALGGLTPVDRLGSLLPSTRGGDLVFYEESQGGTVAVLEQGAASNSFRRLYIQGVSNSGDAMPSLRYMRLQALLPLIIHKGDPRAALVIGFGTGITAGAVSQYEGLRRTVCIELLPAVLRAGSLFRGNFNAASNPAIDLRVGDGRQALMRSAERYDLITLEPPPPPAAGVVNLYSSDFYALAGARLQPDGLFAQWLPLPTQNDHDTRTLVRSFIDVFPYATLWTTELHETLLIGSFSPIELNANRITQRFNQAGVSGALMPVGIASPAALLATWITDRAGLERYAADAAAVTDDRPSIEYAPWVRPTEITRTLPILLALRTEPPVIDADDSLRASIAAMRAPLLDFYAAGIAAYSGDRQSWEQHIVRALKEDGSNPYFRWAAH
jgi:predicted membrane-bound spermidine synthase